MTNHNNSGFNGFFSLSTAPYVYRNYAAEPPPQYLRMWGFGDVPHIWVVDG